jgi:curved DNA-binding protein CbpA
MSAFTDYYRVLGIETNASASDIKSAFKKLALQYHPDVYKGDDAEERMRVLLLAYQTLSDPAERRAFDIRRSEHIMGIASPRNAASNGAAYASTKKRSVDVTPAARRDRQRHYAFPDLSGKLPVHIDLADCNYDLSPVEAQTLKDQGMLRGIAPLPASGVASAVCFCHRCRHRWKVDMLQRDARDAPRFCAACQASDWREYLLLSCSQCHAVFESEQIRYEVGSYMYGKNALCPPYELFPLCPYCGASGWCPVENARVAEQRAQSARHAALIRLILIGIIVVVGLLVLMAAVGII